MSRPLTAFKYGPKASRITVPVACDEHIGAAALEFKTLSQTLETILTQGGRVSERVGAAQWAVQMSAINLRQSVSSTILKTTR
tara:strand:+ start:978 stop:1226 length:249 start_codon:yes stop_codon:yes gene_type:complete